MHQDLVFDAPGSIGGQAGSFAGIKGRNGLDEPKGADGDQIVLFLPGRIVFFDHMGPKTQIVLNQGVPGAQIPLGPFFQSLSLIHI